MPTRTRKRDIMIRAQLRDRLDQFEGAAHSMFRVVFVSLGKAEVSQHSVTHVLGHEAGGPGDNLGAAAVIGTDDIAHILGVQTG